MFRQVASALRALRLGRLLVLVLQGGQHQHMSEVPKASEAASTVNASTLNARQTGLHRRYHKKNYLSSVLIKADSPPYTRPEYAHIISHCQSGLSGTHLLQLLPIPAYA